MDFPSWPCTPPLPALGNITTTTTATTTTTTTKIAAAAIAATAAFNRHRNQDREVRGILMASLAGGSLPFAIPLIEGIWGTKGLQLAFFLDLPVSPTLIPTLQKSEYRQNFM